MNSIVYPSVHSQCNAIAHLFLIGMIGQFYRCDETLIRNSLANRCPIMFCCRCWQNADDARKEMTRWTCLNCVLPCAKWTVVVPLPNIRIFILFWFVRDTGSHRHRHRCRDHMCCARLLRGTQKERERHFTALQHKLAVNKLNGNM